MKIHTTIERDKATERLTVREMSICRDECPDWAWRDEGDIETARISGELVPTSEPYLARFPQRHGEPNDAQG